jgi:hypothetical protein
MKNVVLLDVTSCGSCKIDVSDEGIASIFMIKIINEVDDILQWSNGQFVYDSTGDLQL